MPLGDDPFMADLAGEAARGKGSCLVGSRYGAAEKWADREGLVEAVLTLLAGPVVSWLTGWLTERPCCFESEETTLIGGVLC